MNLIAFIQRTKIKLHDKEGHQSIQINHDKTFDNSKSTQIIKDKSILTTSQTIPKTKTNLKNVSISSKGNGMILQTNNTQHTKVPLIYKNLKVKYLKGSFDIDSTFVFGLNPDSLLNK